MKIRKQRPRTVPKGTPYKLIQSDLDVDKTTFRVRPVRILYQ